MADTPQIAAVTKSISVLESTNEIPDYVTPLDTAVLKTKPVLPVIDYTNLDFSSIKLQLVNLLKANAKLFGKNIQDFSDPNTVGMFLNTAAFMGQMLSYHTDSMVNELYLDNAQSSMAVSKLLNMFAYKPSRPQAGLLLLSITRNKSTAVEPSQAAQEDSAEPFEDVDETLWLVDNTNDASYNANIIDSYIARAILTRIKDRVVPAEHPKPEA